MNPYRENELHLYDAMAGRAQRGAIVLATLAVTAGYGVLFRAAPVFTFDMVLLSGLTFLIITFFGVSKTKAYLMSLAMPITVICFATWGAFWLLRRLYTWIAYGT